MVVLRADVGREALQMGRERLAPVARRVVDTFSPNESDALCALRERAYRPTGNCPTSIIASSPRQTPTTYTVQFSSLVVRRRRSRAVALAFAPRPAGTARLMSSHLPPQAIRWRPGVQRFRCRAGRDQRRGSPAGERAGPLGAGGPSRPLIRCQGTGPVSDSCWNEGGAQPTAAPAHPNHSLERALET
jgi:hypothetical protein